MEAHIVRVLVFGASEYECCGEGLIISFEGPRLC